VFEISLKRFDDVFCGMVKNISVASHQRSWNLWRPRHLVLVPMAFNDTQNNTPPI
jgi:hypothetical protein